MAKTNFSKIEMLLNEGLMQVQVKSLLELADVASGKGEGAKDNPARVLQARKAIARILQHEVSFMYKDNPNIYTMLGIDKDKFFQIVDHADKINNEDWEYLSALKTKVDVFRKGKQAMVNPQKNEELIESQRKKHINKRFNVNDKWLPLR